VFYMKQGHRRYSLDPGTPPGFTWNIIHGLRLVIFLGAAWCRARMPGLPVAR